jgi:hypothetical protein
MDHPLRLYHKWHRRSGRPWIAAAIPLSLAVILLAGCTPLPMPDNEPLRAAAPEFPARSGASEACDPTDVGVEVVHAAWAHVHERYPTQPWPNRVYLVGDYSAASPGASQSMHVVLCSNPTGFVWEGEVVWRLDCACCRVQVEGIRELFVTLPTAVAGPSEPQ